MVSAEMSISSGALVCIHCGGDQVAVEVSADGGATYTTLTTFDKYNGGTTGSYYTNFLAYASASTRLRFRVDNAYGDPDEYFAVDDYYGRRIPWRLYGLGLPDEVLRKVYGENAAKLLNVEL